MLIVGWCVGARCVLLVGRRLSFVVCWLPFVILVCCVSFVGCCLLCVVLDLCLLIDVCVLVCVVVCCVLRAVRWLLSGVRWLLCVA